MKTSIVVVWIVTQFCFLGCYQRFRGTYCLYLRSEVSGFDFTLKMEAIRSFETLLIAYKTTRRHTQKTTVYI
jgi:hypothetical protein